MNLADASLRDMFLLMMQSPFAFAIFKGKDMVISIANDSMKQVLGKGNDIEGKPLLEVLPELRGQPFPGYLEGVYTTGVPFHANEARAKLKRDGQLENVYFNFVYQPYHEPDGTISGITVIAYEVTEQVEAREIKEENEQFRSLLAAIVDSTEDAIISKTLEGIITSWNPAAEKIFGYTAEEMIGQPITRIIPPDRQNEEPAIMERIQKGEVVDHFETRRIAKDGKLLDISLTVSPVRDREGRIIGASKIARDIVRTTRSGELNSRLAAIVQFSEDAIISKTLDGIVMSWNPAAERIFGYSAVEMIGQSITRIIPTDRLNEEPEILKLIQRGEMVDHFETVRRTKTGNLIDISLTISPVKDDEGKIVGASKIARDITKSKMAEALLRQHSVTLENAVKERTAELQQANQSLAEKNLELEKINKELESFTYISSHDMQEPLRKIQTFTDRLLEKEFRNLSDTGKEYFHRMRESAARMQNLILDLLAFSRLSTSEGKLEVCDVKNITEDIKREIREAIEEKRAIVDSGEKCRIMVVPFQFRQLIYNLISNALKFSKPGITPHITVHSRIVNGGEFMEPKLPDGKDYSHISISDNGIGFEPRYRDKIFEVFQKLHGKEEYPGTGIGLAIVKKVVDNHHGIITVKSELGKGSTFNIYIPV